MEASIWTGTLATLRDKVAAIEPVPAGVTTSAVSASLALALLSKVLAIASKKKSLLEHRQRIDELLHAARAESSHLTSLADEDIQAFHQYLESKHEASRKAIEIPMEAARSAVRGLGLCEASAGMIRGLTAGDVGAASYLLAGAARAMLMSVEFNLKEMKSDEEFATSMRAERGELWRETENYSEAIATMLRTQLE